MHHFVRLTDFCHDDVMRIFRTADEIKQGMHTGFLKGKSIVLFFPASIRTWVTFEKRDLSVDRRILKEQFIQ